MRLQRNLLLLLPLLLLSRCDEGTAGEGDAAPDADAEADVTDPGDTAPDAGPSVDHTTCPGVRQPVSGGCEEVPFGSGACVESGESGCADLSVNLPCLDTDGDGYPQDLGNKVLYVSAETALGAGTGAIDDPFPTISAALAAAVPGTTIAVSSNPFENVSQYKEPVVLQDRPGVRLLGPGSCKGKRVRLEGAKKAHHVIKIVDSPGAVVRGFELTGGGGGVSVGGDPSGVRIESLEISLTNGPGIELTSPAKEPATITGCLIRNSTTSACGIRLASTAKVDITGNEVRSIPGVGVCISGSTGVTVSGNTIHDNDGAGITLESGGAAITGNTLRSNDQGGVLVAASASGGEVARNRFVDNRLFGILLQAHVTVPVRENFVRGTITGTGGSGGYGIGANAIGDETVIEHCTIHGGDAPGVALFGTGSGTPSAPPPRADQPSALVRLVSISGAGSAGIFAKGTAPLRLLYNDIEGTVVGSSGAADGISAGHGSFRIEGGDVGPVPRYGVLLTEAKAVISGVTFEGAEPPVACVQTQCPYVSFSGGTISGDADPPPAWTPIVAEELLP